jgi:hypothetical protein
MEENPEKLTALANEWGVLYPVCVDTSGVAAGAFSVTELPRGFLINHEGRLVASYTGMTEKNRNDLLLKMEALNREIIARRSTQTSFWVEPQFQVQEGDPALGPRWAEQVKKIIRDELKRQITPSKDKANYIISGKILAIEDEVNIEVIIRDSAGGEMTRFGASVISGDVSVLRTMLKYRLDALH